MYSPHSVVSIGIVFSLAMLPALAPVPAIAQQSVTVGTSFSIRAAFESALASNPEAVAQQMRLDAFAAKIDAANALTAQSISLEGSYRSDRNFDNQGLRELELGFSAPLWNWNERTHTQSLRNSELEAAKAQFEVTKLQLAGEVRQVVWDTLSAQLDVEIAQTRAQAAKGLVEDVSRRVDAGELAKTDLYQAQALYSKAQSEAVRAMSALADMGIEFSNTTGLPVSVLPGTQAELAANSAALPQPEQPSERSSQHTSEHTSEHPLIKLAQVQLQVLDQQRNLAGSQKRANPEIGLAVINERSALGAGSEKSLIFNTRIPLGNSSEYQARVLDAQANQFSAQAALIKIKRSVMAKERGVGSSLDVFEQLRKSAAEQARLARRVYALYQQSFNMGETDLPTLLRYEQQAFEADRLARKADIEYAARVSAHKQAQGLLPE
ncbi:MAG: TolC family protein [Limnobacter sp.]|nr:TolC family protein [Limnobacter sp.]